MMIKTAIVAMTLLGCDCDAKVCSYIGDTGPQWDTIASCEAAMRKQVVAHSDLQYPLVTAQCRSTETIAAAEPATPVQPVAVAATVEPELTAGGRIALATFRLTNGGYERLKLGVAAVSDGVWSNTNSVLAVAAGWLAR